MSAPSTESVSKPERKRVKANPSSTKARRRKKREGRTEQKEREGKERKQQQAATKQQQEQMQELATQQQPAPTFDSNDPEMFWAFSVRNRPLMGASGFQRRC
jgi:hypothetical protein